MAITINDHNYTYDHNYMTITTYDHYTTITIYDQNYTTKYYHNYLRP